MKNKNIKNNVWTRFNVKKELTELLKKIIRKVLNNESLTEKEIEFLKEISK